MTYEVHVTGESSTSDDYLRRVSSLINSEEDDPGFIGSWMIMATWDNVHPFPHGSSPEQDRVDPYLQSVSSYMHGTAGIIIYGNLTHICAVYAHQTHLYAIVGVSNYPMGIINFGWHNYLVYHNDITIIHYSSRSKYL